MVSPLKGFLKGAGSSVGRELLEIPFYLFEHRSIFSPLSIFLAGIFASVGAQLFITPAISDALSIRTSRLILSAVLFFIFSGMMVWIGLELEGFTKKLSEEKFKFASGHSLNARKIRLQMLRGEIPMDEPGERKGLFRKAPPLYRVGFAILIGILSLIFAFAFLYYPAWR